MTLHNTTLAALALLPLLAPATAHAEEGDIIVSAHGFETPREETGQAVSVIPLETIVTRQSATLTDLLAETVPGLAIARDGGPGAKSSAFIRGGNSSQTLVLIDGVRVNDPSTPNAQFNFGALVTGNVEQVEVLRGPNSVVWGSQAIGGIVNIRNAAPTQALAVRGRAEAGAHDSASGAINASATLGPVAASLGATHYRTDGISSLRAGSERDGFEATALNGRLDIALSGQFSLDLRGYFNRSIVDYDARSIVDYDAQFGATPDTPSTEKNRQFVAYAGLNASLLDGRLRQRIAYSRTDIHRDGTDPTQPVLFSNYNVYTIRGDIERLEYQGSFALSPAISLIGGAEHEEHSAATLYPANGTTTPDRASIDATSLYAQAIVKPLAGLSLTGGLRHDDYEVYGSETSFGANFAYTPNGGATLLRGTYAEGFRAPTLVEAVFPGGNTALKPETVRSFDIGIEQHLLARRVRVALTAFQRRSRNQIAYNFDTFQSENIERVRARGVELELALKPTERLSLTGLYSYVEAIDRATGNDLELRPRQQASVALDWKSPWGFALGGTVRMVGDSYNNRANTQRLDGYQLVSLRASLPITGRIELYGRIENLFDADYEVVRGYAVWGRTGHVGLRWTI